MKPLRVGCVLLTSDRQEMTVRAIRSYRSQSYQQRGLLVLDSGSTRLSFGDWKANETYIDAREFRGSSIGRLRNTANEMMRGWDVIAHFDDDDYSHPERIAEQAATLQASGKKAVGYREVLFWDTRPGVDTITCECGEIWSQHVATVCPKCAAWPAHRGKAWLFSHEDPRYFVGSSMCYWRSAWEACKFDDAPHEDARWFRANAEHCAGFSSLAAIPPAPRMICSIHGGNTEAYHRAEMGQAEEWVRVPWRDDYCRERMKLEGE